MSRIFEVEYSPLVFSVCEGMAPECYATKGWPQCWRKKNNDSYADTIY